MKTATAEGLRSNLDEYLNAHETVVIIDGDRPTAVLVPVTDTDDIERLLSARGADLASLLSEADRRIEETGGIPHDEFWARVEEEDTRRRS